jgi:Holliday junction resolvase RusA-like endonuclease
MKLFLLMEPPTVTAQQAKVAVVGNRPMFYKPEKVKAARQMLIRHLKPFKPPSPYEGAIELHVVWLFPKGKSHKHNEWRITKPDTDNLEKMLKDCMTEVGFWVDDAQVVKEVVEKLWSDEPTGISIEINVLDKFYKEGAT